MQHSEQEIWLKIMDGTLDLSDEEVLKMEKESKDFRERISPLRRAQQELGAAKSEMDLILGEARSAPILDADRTLLDSLPSVEASSGESARGIPHLPETRVEHRIGGSRWRAWSGLAAALVVAVLGFGWYQNRQVNPVPGPGPALGGQGELTLVYPITSPGKPDRFEWQGELEFGSWYVVHVIDLETGNETPSGKLVDNTWRPLTPLNVERFRWFVVLHAASGAKQLTSDTVEILP